MVKRTVLMAILAVITVFVVWQLLDMVVHGVMLEETYAQTANLWRPMAEMKMGLMYVVGFIYATCFVVLYTLLIRPKTLITGVKYGLIFGLGIGIPMGYGTYAYMPIPYHLALVWFLSALVKTLLAGAIVGTFVKE